MLDLYRPLSKAVDMDTLVYDDVYGVHFWKVGARATIYCASSLFSIWTGVEICIEPG